MMRGDSAHGSPKTAEAMKERPPRHRPILEFDAEFERGAGLANKIDLIDPQRGIECPQRGQSRFANTDRYNLRGLDQKDLSNTPAEQHAQRGGGHPPCAAAADDHYSIKSRAWHQSKRRLGLQRDTKLRGVPAPAVVPRESRPADMLLLQLLEQRIRRVANLEAHGDLGGDLVEERSIELTISRCVQRQGPCHI